MAAAAEMAAEAPFRVVPIANKGAGCIATRSISAGERLLAESPLLVLPPSPDEGIPSEALDSLIASLPSRDQERFFELSQEVSLYGDAKSAVGIAGTNGIPFHHRSKQYGGIFATAARFNHACDSNACYKWNAKREQLTVHATRPISADEEICINYGGFLRVREERQRHLSESFGFECVCAKCRLTGDALTESDERIRRIGDEEALGAALGRWCTLEHLLLAQSKEVLGALDAKVALMAEEAGHRGPLHKTETFAQAFVEFCDSCHVRLAELARRGEAYRRSESSEDDGVMMTFRERRVRVSLSDLHSEAEAYRQAARRWASRGKELARMLAGEDSPSFAVYDMALQRCWREEEEGSQPSESADGDGTRRRREATSFSQLWVDAGLSV